MEDVPFASLPWEEKLRVVCDLLDGEVGSLFEDIEAWADGEDPELDVEERVAVAASQIEHLVVQLKELSTQKVGR